MDTTGVLHRVHGRLPPILPRVAIACLPTDNKPGPAPRSLLSPDAFPRPARSQGVVHLFQPYIAGIARWLPGTDQSRILLEGRPGERYDSHLPGKTPLHTNPH